MAVALTNNFINELKKGINKPNVIIDLGINTVVRWIADGTFLADGSITAGGDDGGTDRTTKHGFSTGGFTDVIANLKSISSLQNKIDPKGGFTSLGQISITLTGRDSFKSLIGDEFLKNRRVTRQDGFEGLAFSDYASTFTGTIQEWSRKGDDLVIQVQDDMVSAKKKIPVENINNTQFLDYTDTNPVDMITDILLNQLNIPADKIDTTQFENERDTWLSGWKFDRVLRKPEDATKILNELQIETNSFIINDGEKISFKHFGPVAPGETVTNWTDNDAILENSFSIKSGYNDNFYNRIFVYYDYDESGDDKTDNYDSAIEVTDPSSQSSAQWDETKTKVIKAKGIKSRTYTQPVNINISGTAVTIYQVARYNDVGAGVLTFNQVNNTLTWKAPSGTTGDAVELTKDGIYQLFDADATKSIRVIVDTTNLPATGQNDNISITALQGSAFATTIATELINRYRDPAAEVTFDVDINYVAKGNSFIKPTDLIDLTTDEGGYKTVESLDEDRFMIISTRPDLAKGSVAISAIRATMSNRYGFIAPSGFPDYADATEAQRAYAFIGRASDNKVFDGVNSVPGYLTYY